MVPVFYQEADEWHCQKEGKKPSKNKPPIMYACEI